MKMALLPPLSKIADLKVIGEDNEKYTCQFFL